MKGKRDEKGSGRKGWKGRSRKHIN